MNFRTIIPLFCLALLSACGQSGRHEHQEESPKGSKVGSDSIYSRVMDDHNIAMAKMGQLTRYQELCKKASDSLSGKKDPATIAQKARLDSLRSQLKTVEDDMNHWMESFEPDSAGSTEESKLKFYTVEKNKVGAIKDHMISLLAKADSLLEK